MGDASDMSDLERFMRSPEGQAHLEGIRTSLVGRRIVSVEYANDIYTIGIVLNLDDGTTFDCQRPKLDVDALREEFAEVLEREYYADYPDRRPSATIT